MGISLCGAQGAHTLEQDGVLASWSTESELVKGEDLSTSLEDSRPSALSHTQSTHSQFGNFEEAKIVSDGTNNHRRLALPVCLCHLPHLPNTYIVSSTPRTISSQTAMLSAAFVAVKNHWPQSVVTLGMHRQERTNVQSLS